jgi:hypothetical protein
MCPIWKYDNEMAWEYENGYYLTSPSSRLAKAIAHWELYKKILPITGDIVECGVYKGASAVRFATYREILESQDSRKIIGFDAFGKFPESSISEDAEFIENFESCGGEGIPIEELLKTFEQKGFRNYEFIKGNIIETIPDYIEKNEALRIALLHIDVDVYEPTKVILDRLFGKVVRNGLIVFDDYGTVSGETKAVDAFFKQNNMNYTIKKMPYYKVPSFVIKV